MFDLENITVFQFFQLNEERAYKYVELQSIMNDKPEFLKSKAKSLGHLSYGQVAKLKRTISKPTFENLFEAFHIVFGVKMNQYLNADIVSYFYALNWIRKSVKNILQKEFKALQSDVDPYLEMAGVKRLAAFGEMSTLITLGRQFSKTPEEIENWKYNLVFSIMLYDKVYGEVNKSYNEIKKSHAKKTN